MPGAMDPRSFLSVCANRTILALSCLHPYSNTESFLDDPTAAATPQQDWLAARLKAAGECPVIVMVHHPPYSLDDDHHGSPAIVDALDVAAKSAERWPDAVLSANLAFPSRVIAARSTRNFKQEGSTQV